MKLLFLFLAIFLFPIFSKIFKKKQLPVLQKSTHINQSRHSQTNHLETGESEVCLLQSAGRLKDINVWVDGDSNMLSFDVLIQMGAGFVSMLTEPIVLNENVPNRVMLRVGDRINPDVVIGHGAVIVLQKTCLKSDDDLASPSLVVLDWECW